MTKARPVSISLTPEEIEILDRLAVALGGRSKAVKFLIKTIGKEKSK